jgi:hypothetical protein
MLQLSALSAMTALPGVISCASARHDDSPCKVWKHKENNRYPQISVRMKATLRINHDFGTVVATEDASAKMFSVYISQAERYDKALVTAWRADMKGILIFVSFIGTSDCR